MERKRNLERRRAHGEEARVEYVELFFDLVFVFAVTQISHSLLAHLTLAGALQSAFLLLAVWWVWVFTAWVTNWMDPRLGAVKLLLFALMLAGLVLSSSLPEAFEERGLAFAAAYVFMQIGRSAFMLWALRHHNPGNFLNFLRITQWLVLSGLFWLAGAFFEGEARFAVWIAALAIEYAGPAARFWTPWNGASSTTDWDVDGGHMAERSALFVVIALGESVLVTGATFAEHEWSGPVVLAFLASFVGTVAMWWLYFSIGADTARHKIEHSNDPGRIARVAFTYLPVLLIAGIVVAAVADELVLAHPVGHHAEPAMILTVVGGPALYVDRQHAVHKFYVGMEPTPVARPRLIKLNRRLAVTLGLDPDYLSNPEGVEVLAGSRVPEGAEPVAMAYAGHQFGHFVPQLLVAAGARTTPSTSCSIGSGNTAWATDRSGLGQEAGVSLPAQRNLDRAVGSGRCSLRLLHGALSQVHNRRVRSGLPAWPSGGRRANATSRRARRPRRSDHPTRRRAGQVEYNDGSRPARAARLVECRASHSFSGVVGGTICAGALVVSAASPNHGTARVNSALGAPVGDVAMVELLVCGCPESRCH